MVWRRSAGHTPADEVGAHGLGAARAQIQVILGGALFVAMSLDGDLVAGAGDEPAGVVIEDAAGLVGERIAVIGEVHRLEAGDGGGFLAEGGRSRGPARSRAGAGARRPWSWPRSRPESHRCRGCRAGAGGSARRGGSSVRCRWAWRARTATSARGAGCGCSRSGPMARTRMKNSWARDWVSMDSERERGIIVRTSWGWGPHGAL